MSAAAPPDPHAELASLVGTRIAQQLWHTLPEIAKALGPEGLDKASFTAKMRFASDEDGFSVAIRFTSDIPVPEVSMKIGWLDKQLSLLPPPTATPTATPEPPAAPAPGLPAPVETGFQGRRPEPDEAGVGNT